MAKKVLVVYDTMFGSAAEVADCIGKELGKQGKTVTVKRVADVPDISGYEAVVVGAPVRGSKLIPGAMDFLTKNEQALGRKPLALFTVCLGGSDGPEGCTRVMERTFTPLLQQFSALKPVSIGIFGGVVDFNKYPEDVKTVMGKVMERRGRPTEGCNDYRDWNVIKAWSQELAEKL